MSRRLQELRPVLLTCNPAKIANAATVDEIREAHAHGIIGPTVAQSAIAIRKLRA